MTKVIRSTALLFGGVLFGSSCHQQPSPGPDQITPGILRALIAQAPAAPVTVAESGGAVRPFVLATVDEILLRDTIPEDVLAAVRSLRTGFAHPLIVDSALIASVGIVRTGPAGATVSHTGTDIVITAFGFNPDSTVVAVYWGFSCGPLCGGDGISVFRRHNADSWLLDRHMPFGAI